MPEQTRMKARTVDAEDILAAKADTIVASRFLEDEGVGWMISACRFPSVRLHDTRQLSQTMAAKGGRGVA